MKTDLIFDPQKPSDNEYHAAELTGIKFIFQESFNQFGQIFLFAAEC